MSEYKQEIMTTEMISGNLIKETQARFQELGYKVDLFFEFFVISGVFAAKEEIPFERVASDALERYKVKERDVEKFLEISEYYYVLVSNLYSYLLHEDRADEHESVMMDKMNSLSSALFHQLPMTLLPSALFNSIEKIVPTLFVTFESYDVDLRAKDFLEQIEKKMGHFVGEKVEHFFMVMFQLQKESKKLKRVNKEMTQHAKFFIMNFIVVCWDVMIRHEENENA